MMSAEAGKRSDYGSLCMTALGLQIFVLKMFENHGRVWEPGCGERQT